MQALKTLIDSASKVCGGDAALARKLGVSKSLVSLMRKGSKKVTPVQAAKLADIAGYDLDAALRMAVIEAARDTPDEWLITEIVGKGRAAGAGEMSRFSYKGDSIYSTERGSRTTEDGSSQFDELHIVSSKRRTKRGLRAWVHAVLAKSGEIARAESPMGWA